MGGLRERRGSKGQPGVRDPRYSPMEANARSRSSGVTCETSRSDAGAGKIIVYGKGVGPVWGQVWRDYGSLIGVPVKSQQSAIVRRRWRPSKSINRIWALSA